MTLYRNAFTDLRLTVEDMIAEGETVMARWSCRGAHKGKPSGIAPTGKQIAISGVTVCGVANGKIVKGWGQLGCSEPYAAVVTKLCETGRVKLGATA